MKLTPWYPPDTNPWRKGWYECKCCNLRYFWSGKSWDNTDIGGSSLQQNIEWRGLTKRSDDAGEP
jgi:hypothetical protein